MVSPGLAVRPSLACWWLPGVVGALKRGAGGSEFFPWVFAVTLSSVAVAAAGLLAPGALVQPVALTATLLLTRPLLIWWCGNPSLSTTMLVAAALASLVDAWVLWPHDFIHTLGYPFAGCFEETTLLFPWFLLFSSLLAAGVRSLWAWSPRIRGSLARPGRPVVLAASLGVVLLALYGLASQARRRVDLDYAASLHELGRISLDTSQEPWLRTSAGFSARVGDLEIFSRGESPHGQNLYLALAGAQPGEHGEASRGEFSLRYMGVGALIVRRDLRRHLIVLELLGDAGRGYEKPTRGTSHDRTRHLLALREPSLTITTVSRAEIAGPQPLPLAWALLAAAGAVIAALFLRREQALLGALARPEGYLVGWMDAQGRFETEAPLAAVPGVEPVVVIPRAGRRSEGAAVVYRAAGELSPLAVLPGSEEQVLAAAQEARSEAATLALAILALTAAPLLVAIVA